MFSEYENILKKTPVCSLFIVNPFGPKRRENHTKYLSFYLFTSMGKQTINSISFGNSLMITTMRLKAHRICFLKYFNEHEENKFSQEYFHIYRVRKELKEDSRWVPFS